MSEFERLQIITAIVQSIILFLTLLAAICIGLKQAKISKRQADISETQTIISKKLADLPFVVSVEVTYDTGLRQLNIANKGQTNVYLWGSKLGSGAKLIEKEPRLITPGGFYYLLAESIEGDLRKGIEKQTTDARESFLIYLTSQNDIKYVVSTLILGKRNGDQITIHTQTTSIKPEEW